MAIDHLAWLCLLLSNMYNTSFGVWQACLHEYFGIILSSLLNVWRIRRGTFGDDNQNITINTNDNIISIFIIIIRNKNFMVLIHSDPASLCVLYVRERAHIVKLFSQFGLGYKCLSVHYNTLFMNVLCIINIRHSLQTIYSLNARSCHCRRHGTQFICKRRNCVLDFIHPTRIYAAFINIRLFIYKCSIYVYDNERSAGCRKKIISPKICVS